MLSTPKLPRSRRGATLIEMALSLMAFLMFTLGIIEGSFATWSWVTLCHATRQGARYGMVHGVGAEVPDSNVEDVVRGHAVGLIPDYLTVTTAWTPDKTRGSSVRVQSTYNHRTMFGSVLFPGTTIPLGTTSQMTIIN